MSSAEREPIDPELAEAVEEIFDAAAAPAGADSDQASSEQDGGVGQPVTDEVSAEPGAGSVSSEAAALEAEPSVEEKLAAQVTQLTDDLARARADHYNLQQEYQGFVRRSREGAQGHREAGQAVVVEALIPVLDEVELARQHGDLSGPFEAMATKLEGVLSDKFGLVRFGEKGELFDPAMHEALMAVESAEVSEPTIELVLQPGYRLGEKVVRAARVQVANPA